MKLILRIVLVKGVPPELSERVAFLDEITFDFSAKTLGLGSVYEVGAEYGKWARLNDK